MLTDERLRDAAAHRHRPRPRELALRHPRRKYLDIVSSWWANLLGHCNPDINAAIKEQLDKLEHVIFANFSHKPAIALAEQLNRITPAKIQKFHFNDNGSASVECALKMCFQFYQQGGKPEKKRFMCLTGGYHGETIGALSVGSMDLYAKLYQPMMMKNIHIERRTAIAARTARRGSIASASASSMPSGHSPSMAARRRP